MADVPDALRRWRENKNRDKTVVRAIFGFSMMWCLPYDLEESGYDWYIKWGLLRVNETRGSVENWVVYRPYDDNHLVELPGLDLKRPICDIDAQYATTVESIQEYRHCWPTGEVDHTEMPSSARV